MMTCVFSYRETCHANVGATAPWEWSATLKGYVYILMTVPALLVTENMNKEVLLLLAAMSGV